MNNKLWTIKAYPTTNSDDMDLSGPIYLHHHIHDKRSMVEHEVMAAARREGFNGTLSERLKELNWKIVEIEFQEVK